MYRFLLLSFVVASLIMFRQDFSVTRKTGANSDELNIRTTESVFEKVETFLDSSGKPAYAIDKHYAMVVYRYDPTGRIIEETYYDEAGNPAIQLNSSYGVKYEYHEGSSSVLMTYLDEVLLCCFR